MNTLVVYDVHAHAGKWPFAEYAKSSKAGSAAREYIKSFGPLDGFGGKTAEIRTFCSSFDAFLNPVPYAANRKLQKSVAHRSACTYIPVINPLIADAEEMTASYRKSIPFIKILPSFHSFPLDSPQLSSLCESLNAKILREKPGIIRNRPILMLQMRIEDERNQNPILNLNTPSLDDIRSFARTYPELPIIVLGLYLDEIIELLPQSPHIYADIAFAETFDTLDTLCSHVSYKQLLFGSNAPLFSRSASLRKILYSSLSDTWKEAIFSKNLQQLLNAEY